MAIVANASGGQSCSRGIFSFVDAACATSAAVSMTRTLPPSAKHVTPYLLEHATCLAYPLARERRAVVEVIEREGANRLEHQLANLGLGDAVASRHPASPAAAHRPPCDPGSTMARLDRCDATSKAAASRGTRARAVAMPRAVPRV